MRWFWTLKLLSSIRCQSRPGPGCAGSLRALALGVIPESHLQKLRCAERGRSSRSPPLLKSHSLWASGKCAQPWRFLFPGLLGEKLSFPAGEEGKALQKLCTPEEDPGPGVRSSTRGLCFILGVFWPKAVSVLLLPLAIALLSWQLSPFPHTSAARDPFLCLHGLELPSAPLRFGLSVENDTQS